MLGDEAVGIMRQTECVAEICVVAEKLLGQPASWVPTMRPYHLFAYVVIPLLIGR